MRPVTVRGIGLWTPGFASPEAWCRRVPDSEVIRPQAALLDGPLRRRASGLTRISVEAFEQAIRQAGADASNVPSVWATAHGEHATAIKLLAMMRRGEGKLSPTHFHNSVHNTASGYASILTNNTAPSTTLTGGGELAFSALLEGFGYVEAFERDVVVVLADEPLMPPFGLEEMQAELALAFHLSANAQGGLAQLSRPRIESVAPVKPRAPFGPLYVSGALPLLERIVLGEPGTVALELEPEQPRPIGCLDVSFPARG